jgi:hypothetical protein
MNVSGTGLSGSQTFNGAAARTFTVTSNATSSNTGSTIVARDGSGNFSAGTITASLSGNATTAATLQTSRTIALSGDVSGSSSFNGGSNITINATVADDSHNHIISNVDGLQTALDGKASLASPAFTGTPTAPTAATGTNTTQIASTAFVIANALTDAPSDDKYYVRQNGQWVDNTIAFTPVDLVWNANADSYIKDTVDKRNIDTHVRLRRCLLTDAGAVTYLDADDTTKLAGDWLRLVETTELDTEFTGVHGSERQNLLLRGSATSWAAGTYSKGDRVIYNDKVWECIATSTTATPAAGTSSATLNGSAGQVMLEVPRFSIKHNTSAAGSYTEHTFNVAYGTKTDEGYQVHPAFVKPDSNYRDFFYVGAYQGTGTNGNGSASGVNNTVAFTRAAHRSACSGRGSNWHMLGYYYYDALKYLVITEYADMNSARVLGNGAFTGNTYVTSTGLSNSDGNGTQQSSNSYVTYRGMENIIGRANQWCDGCNANGSSVYLNNDPSEWADDTTTNYTAAGTIPLSGGGYIRDVKTSIALLPDNVTGANFNTFTGDGLYSATGWRVLAVGGDANIGGTGGIFYHNWYQVSTGAFGSYGGRLMYSEQ